MLRRTLVLPALALLAGAVVFTAVAADAPTTAPEMKLPPGWTQDDMNACMAAATPGKQQEQLAKGVGDWDGKNTMWMFPGADPLKSQCTSKVSSIFDGRYVKIEMTGEMPGMGPYNAIGFAGYDNALGSYVSNWLDNMGTGIMYGKGELSNDGKIMTWLYTYQCPITKKPATMREVETVTGEKTKTLDIFSTDPKSGKEFKMMAIEFTKK